MPIYQLADQPGQQKNEKTLANKPTKLCHFSPLRLPTQQKYKASKQESKASKQESQTSKPPTSRPGPRPSAPRWQCSAPGPRKGPPQQSPAGQSDASGPWTRTGKTMLRRRFLSGTKLVTLLVSIAAAALQDSQLFFLLTIGSRWLSAPSGFRAQQLQRCPLVCAT